ncbi:hypothetical protein Acin_1759 [Acidaminococcus intestini RyC-MR95]|uniref:Uncharacterized protein n=1 Tax=Acidaminococcus intestini (strain RyC-MR95) TaxID=568816 RepID=G4Q3H5_ACIIR|nr:hypothetical protein Acin_1759 [Acidaminococcus intestini RyC-MR95]
MRPFLLPPQEGVRPKRSSVLSLFSPERGAPFNVRGQDCRIMIFG